MSICSKCINSWDNKLNNHCENCSDNNYCVSGYLSDLPSPVRTFDIGSLFEMIDLLKNPKPDEYPEINLSWFESGVKQKLFESRYSPYDGFNAPSHFWSGAAYGEGSVVAVSYDGYIMRSRNGGKDWDLMRGVENMSCIAYGGGVFIILSSSGLGLISRDFGFNFSPLSVPIAPFSAIAYSGGVFAAVTSDGRIFITGDEGLSWGEVFPPEQNSFTALCAGEKGCFCALSSDGENRCVFSADYGATWAAYPMPEQNQWASVTYNDRAKTWAACSPDGEDRFALWIAGAPCWVGVKAPRQISWRAVCAGGGVFTAVASDGELIQAASSYDGKKWIGIETPSGEWAVLVRSKLFFIAFSEGGESEGLNVIRASNGGLTSALFADFTETLQGEEAAKAISPKMLQDKILSYFPLSAENGGTGNTNGIAPSAEKLNNPINIQISDASGVNLGAAISFDGSENIIFPMPQIINAYNEGTSAFAEEAGKAIKLKTARNIGGVLFDGTADINLPGVNIAGNQNTSGKAAFAGRADTAAIADTAASCTGNAASATKLKTARTIGGVAFDGTANINLPGVNVAGNQNTSGKAATAGRADSAATADSADYAATAVSAGTANSAAQAASCTGNAATATKLQNARTISLTGAVTGSASTDFSGNVSIATTLAASGFISQSGNNGNGQYVKFSNGLIVQWGRKNITNGILDTYTLPYAFSNTAYSLVISPYHSTGGGWASSVYNSGSQTFKASVWIINGGVPESFSFFAIGF